MNAIRVIFPYKHEGQWVFDDDRVGLSREPFIAGTDRIIDELVKEIPGAQQGFKMFFSDSPFPGAQVHFKQRRKELGGYWYFVPELGMEGWLCPALFKYFREAPWQLHIRCEAKA